MAHFSWRKRTIADGVLLLLLVLIGANPKLSAAQTTDGDCSVLVSECFETDLCNACVTTIEGVGEDAVTGALSTEGEEVGCAEYGFDEESVCDLLGVSYCCSAEYSGEDCFTDGATLDYWECVLGMNGCDTQDMPCIKELSATASDEDLTSTSDRDIDGAGSNSDAETADDNGVPMGRGGGGVHRRSSCRSAWPGGQCRRHAGIEKDILF